MKGTNSQSTGFTQQANGSLLLLSYTLVCYGWQPQTNFHLSKNIHVCSFFTFWALLFGSHGDNSVQEDFQENMMHFFADAEANFSYQDALSDTQVAIVNIFSSASGLFTLILVAAFLR
ncbi:Solute carrier family 35 member F5, partial [Galemys pyrenaicus]